MHRPRCFAFAHVAYIGYIDTITAFYKSTISSFLDKNAAATDVTYSKRRFKEWFADACQDAKTQARYLEGRFKLTTSAADRAICQNSLKAMHALHNRKRVDATMRSIKEAEGNSGNMWRALDRAIGTTTTSFTYAHTADAFAYFFADKIAASS